MITHLVLPHKQRSPFGEVDYSPNPIGVVFFSASISGVSLLILGEKKIVFHANLLWGGTWREEQLVKHLSPLGVLLMPKTGY